MDVTGLAATVFGGGTRVIYECRRCGTNLGSAAAACQYCGPTDVVRFELGR